MLQISAPATSKEPFQQSVSAKVNKDTSGSLEDAFGAGKGKHAGKKRRRHSNKYSSKSKAAEIDPWEQQLRKSEESIGEAEALERAQLEELEKKRIQRRIERGLVEYPDEEDIDPYDPSTFGYIEVSHSVDVNPVGYWSITLTLRICVLYIFDFCTLSALEILVMKMDSCSVTL